MENNQKQQQNKGILSWVKSVWDKKFLLILLAFMIIFLPVAMTREPVVLSKLLLTSIGIEKDESGYVVHGEIFIFNFDPFGVMERELVKGEGATVDEALTNMGHNLGQTPSLSHCSVIILGNGTQGEDILELLKPFATSSQINNSCALFYTTSDMEELMQTSIDTGDARSGRIHAISAFNKRQNKMTSTNLEQFFIGSMHGNKTIHISRLTVEDNRIINERTPVKFIAGRFTE